MGLYRGPLPFRRWPPRQRQGYESYEALAKTYSKLKDPANRKKATDFYVSIQIAGTPDDCLQKIAELQRITGLEHLICEFAWGGLPHELAESNMRLFAADVLPVLQRDAAFATRARAASARQRAPHTRTYSHPHEGAACSAIAANTDGRKPLMITKFDSLYAGHTDLENCGYEGTPINSRRYANEHLASSLTKAEAKAKMMEANGFDTLWMAEHHFQREGTECIPNVLMMALHLAHKTKRLRFGCGFNIAPMWHPLRLAEDYAMADILSGGRITFGVGRGYHSREVERSVRP